MSKDDWKMRYLNDCGWSVVLDQFPLTHTHKKRQNQEHNKATRRTMAVWIDRKHKKISSY